MLFDIYSIVNIVNTCSDVLFSLLNCITLSLNDLVYSHLLSSLDPAIIGVQEILETFPSQSFFSHRIQYRIVCDDK